MTFRACELAQVKAYEPQRVMHPRVVGIERQSFFGEAHRR